MYSENALRNVKVADFTWAIAGPAATRCLADFGATVVRIESKLRPCYLRTSPPFKNNKPGLDRSGFYALYNCNKYSLALNLAHPRSKEIAQKLVAWADVVCENFGPGVMEKWGLSYAEISRIKPDIIMLRSSNQGQTGPHSHHRGYAYQQAALAGVGNIVGWPDRLPSHPVGYGDIIAALGGIIAVVAALDYRRRTGRGQYIDLSQFETTVHFLAPLVLDYTANGRQFIRAGNRCNHAAPHGVYPCRGDDSWCAIAVFSDDEWQNFCQCIGNPSWTREPRFATLVRRKENEDELDKLVAEWTRLRSAVDVMKLMQAAGVSAGIVLNERDVLSDYQLVQRNFFWELNHSDIGIHHVEDWGFRLSETPAQARMSFPRLGEHSEFVCTQLLDMSDQDFVNLVREGIFE